MGPEGKLLMNGESHQSISICSDDSPIFSIDGSQEGDSYTFRIDEGFLTNSDNPTFDPVSLGFVFAPGVTYSVDAIIYDQPLNPANDTPDPSACYGYTSSMLILSDPQVCP